MKNFFEGFDLLDATVIVALFYLMVVSTLGIAVPDMIEPIVKWIGLILAFLLGKKTPNTIGK